MPYTNGDGTYHDRRTCRRLHRTGDRIQRTEDTAELAPCDHCVDDGTYEQDIAELIEAGICPWCGDEYENVAAHASQVHKLKWAAYSD